MIDDITHCQGIGCPIKDKCKRNDYFKKNSLKKYEMFSSFIDTPFTIKSGKFNCEMYLGNKSDYLFDQLKSILNGKNT